MGKSSQVKKRFTGWIALPWYPFIFSLYPILALLNANSGQVDPNMGIRPALASLCLAAILFGLIFLFFRNIYRTAFLTLLWLALFFSYGHLQYFIRTRTTNSPLPGYLIYIWLVLTVLSWLWVSKTRFYPANQAGLLNVIFLGLVLSLLAQLMGGVRSVSASSLGARDAPVQEDLVGPQAPPDIYYIILDSYGREDLLQESYGYDNSAFIDALRDRGFYVAQCGQSNYSRTELSLSSTLNMSYLQGLDPAFVPESTNRPALWRALKHSAVRYNFEKLGYQTIGFATGFEWNELEDADLFLSPPLTNSMTEFETLFLGTTLGVHAQQWGLIDTDAFIVKNYRNRTLFVFDMLDDIARMAEPTFAYIHVIPPHPPFVFGPDGEPTDLSDFWDENRKFTADSYARGYQNQVTFLNKILLPAMDTLIAESDVPPIIILQGDHGPWFQPRENQVKILSAYYLPENIASLYPEITPVNTFRLIFNLYFGGRYSMLPDHSYFSPVPRLFEFSEITNPCVQ